MKQFHGEPVRFDYSEGLNVTDPKLLQAAKISFHASGVINAADERSFRDSLRTLTEAQLLCFVLFQHPSQFAPVSKIKKRDILLTYPFDEKRPLQGQIYIAPLMPTEAKQPVLVEDAAIQINPVLEFPNLQEMPARELQLVLYHSTHGPWPPNTYLVWQARLHRAE